MWRRAELKGARASPARPARPIRRTRDEPSGRNTRRKQEVWHSALGTVGRRHGGLRAGPERATEAERRRRRRRDQAEEEEKGQGQGEAPGGDGDEQEEGGGEAALPGQADAGAGGLREDAGETANGADPEESIQNPQAARGGLQQTPGRPHRALRHPQGQLDQVGLAGFLETPPRRPASAATGPALPETVPSVLEPD